MKKTHPWRKTYRPERSVPKKARKAAEKKGENMTFTDAMKMAIDGMRVQRTGWHDVPRHVVANPLWQTFRIYHDETEARLYVPSQVDVVSNDWEIAR